MNEEKGEALVKAANAADPDIIQDLVSHGAPIDARSKTGWTPLRAVANTGSLELVQYLAEHGADDNAKNENGWTPLMWATLKGFSEIVRYLAERGADKDARGEDGNPPLHLAASSGHLDIVRFLADQGVAVGGQNKLGQLPLTLAARQGRLDIVNMCHGPNRRRRRRTGIRHRHRGDRLGRRCRAEPAAENARQHLPVERFAQVVVHTGSQTTLAIACYHIGSQRDDRHMGLAAFKLTDRAGGITPVHFGHGNIHEDQVVAAGRLGEEFYGLPPVLRAVDGDAGRLQ